MSRSIKKGPYIDYRLIKKIQSGQEKIIKTWSRRACVSPEMVGATFGVHNGKNFINVFITEDMVGHLLGEFSPTRKFIKHGGKIAREQEQTIKDKPKT